MDKISHIFPEQSNSSFSRSLIIITNYSRGTGVWSFSNAGIINIFSPEMPLAFQSGLCLCPGSSPGPDEKHLSLGGGQAKLGTRPRNKSRLNQIPCELCLRTVYLVTEESRRTLSRLRRCHLHSFEAQAAFKSSGS